MYRGSSGTYTFCAFLVWTQDTCQSGLIHTTAAGAGNDNDGDGDDGAASAMKEKADKTIEGEMQLSKVAGEITVDASIPHFYKLSDKSGGS